MARSSADELVDTIEQSLGAIKQAKLGRGREFTYEDAHAKARDALMESMAVLTIFQLDDSVESTTKNDTLLDAYEIVAGMVDDVIALDTKKGNRNVDPLTYIDRDLHRKIAGEPSRIATKIVEINADVDRVDFTGNPDEAAEISKTTFSERVAPITAMAAELDRVGEVNAGAFQLKTASFDYFQNSDDALAALNKYLNYSIQAVMGNALIGGPRESFKNSIQNCVYAIVHGDNRDISLADKIEQASYKVFQALASAINDDNRDVFDSAVAEVYQSLSEQRKAITSMTEQITALEFPAVMRPDSWKTEEASVKAMSEIATQTQELIAVGVPQQVIDKATGIEQKLGADLATLTQEMDVVSVGQ